MRIADNKVRMKQTAKQEGPSEPKDRRGSEVVDTFKQSQASEGTLGIKDLWKKAKEGWENEGWVYAAGAGMYVGAGTLLGSLVGAPLVGAVKGAEVFATQACGDALINSKTFQSEVFNWSRTMPNEANTAKDVDYGDPKTQKLFHANLGTNLAVCLAVPAAVGGIVFGLPGALAVGAFTLVASPLVNIMDRPY